MFEACEIREILEVASVHLKAMTLLGINCGFGQTDCVCLTKNSLSFESDWIEFTRPKTGVMRKCPLWPETTNAIKESMLQREKILDDENRELVFLTR